MTTFLNGIRDRNVGSKSLNWVTETGVFGSQRNVGGPGPNSSTVDGIFFSLLLTSVNIYGVVCYTLSYVAFVLKAFPEVTCTV